MLLFDTFKDTIFLKEDSTLEKQRDALNKLLKEYSNREDIVEELYLINKTMVDGGIAVEELRVNRQNGEDVFLQLMGGAHYVQSGENGTEAS